MKIIIKHLKFITFSNLEGNRLANESLDVFLQLLCPFVESKIGTDSVGAVSVLPTDGILSSNRNIAI